MLEIKGLRIRSTSHIKTVVMDAFGLKFQDIVSAECKNDTIYLRLSNSKIENTILCENDERARHHHSKLCIRKVRDSHRMHDHHNAKYSDTFFKIYKIPINWNVDDVVKYFEVSCNAPLRTCYRLNHDPDSTASQHAFVEFIASESADRARNILDRNRFNHCLGMKPIETNEVSRILQRNHALYSHPQTTADIDNNGGSRAFGSCCVKRSHNNRNNNRNTRHSKPAHSSNGHHRSSTLNGHRIKRKLNKVSKLKRLYPRNRKDTHAKKLKKKAHKRKNKKQNKRRSKTKAKAVEESSDESDSSSSSEYSSDSYCSSCVSTDDEDSKEMEEGEIEMTQSRKLRHITRNNNTNGKIKKMDIPSDGSVSASPSIDSCTSNSDKLMICGYDICSAAKIKKVTKKIERSAQFIHASLVSDEDIVSIWNNIISFFSQHPAHYMFHLDYVVSLIVCLIKCHPYLIRLSSFLTLPITCLLELCSGNSIKIIEAFLSVPCQRFHQQFQNILIHNIDAIVSHNAGADLIKLSFGKLCKSSLYNIVQVIDAKNYKQLSKKLIPIIRNRSFQPSHQTTINSMTTNIILSPAPSTPIHHIPPPPPPPPPKNHKKHKLSEIVYPPRKKQKIETDSIPVDPRLIRNCKAKPIKIVYKRWKSSDSLMVLEWNVNADLISKNVQTCVSKVMASDALQDVSSLVQSCGENAYGFCEYLNGYLSKKEKCNFDTAFYYALFDVMQIVFQIPDELYTVVDLNGDRAKILQQLRSVCKEETVLFVKKVDPYLHTFCVCSQRLGIVHIEIANRSKNNALSTTLEELMSVNENDTGCDKQCIEHFQSICNVWKSKGIYFECVPKNETINDCGDLNAKNHHWLNAFVVYLYLALDICRIEYIKIRNQYLNDLMNVSMSSWSGALPLRVLYYLLAEIKKAPDQTNKMQKIKPNFCGLEVTATNGL
eukprot:1001178_1